MELCGDDMNWMRIEVRRLDRRLNKTRYKESGDK